MRKLLLPGFLAMLLISTASPVFAQESPEMEKMRNEALNLFKQSKFPESAKIMEQLVEKAPLSAVNHYWYGETLYMQKKYDEAALEFKQARNIDANEPYYASRCAEAYLAAGKTADAIAICDLGLSQCKDPGHKKTLEGIKQLATGTVKPRPKMPDPEAAQGGSGK